MRKLNILKAIIDFYWILSMPVILIILFFIPALFFIKGLESLHFRINGMDILVSSLSSKIIIAIYLFSYLIIIYTIYLFKKVLRYFKNLKIFDNYVIAQFNKIGYLLIIASFLNGISIFVFRIMVKQKFSIDIGLSSFILLISLGLFFMILSEIFKISQTMKRENDLTV